ncbi:nucleotide pyrophosphohydrolase [Flavobacteriaceae bacterium]|nr:nucleotide pyrophosphohydrolase [Flavobacteriaceae bacterium]
MDSLIKKLRKFSEDRDWEQFHSPKNLVMALTSEVGELSDIFQWISEEQSKLDNIDPKDLDKAKEELADVFLYTLRIADKLGIDLKKEANKKIEVNGKKYPINLSKGNSTKYSRRNE